MHVGLCADGEMPCNGVLMTGQGEDEKGEREGAGSMGAACVLRLLRAAECFVALCNFPEMASRSISSTSTHATDDDTAVHGLELVVIVQSM